MQNFSLFDLDYLAAVHGSSAEDLGFSAPSAEGFSVEQCIKFMNASGRDIEIVDP